MHREYRKWHSPALGREMEMLIYGHGGMPMVVFPTSQGRFFEFEDQGMIAAVRQQYESGRIQAFCVDSVDKDTLYAKWMRPADRLHKYNAYQAYILQEVLPLVRYRNWSPRIATIGCSLGGYHAMNLALKNPGVFTDCISMSGAFDIRMFLGGYYDDNVYFNNPVDYLPNQHDEWYLGKYRNGNRYILATGDWDICLGDNQRFDAIMHAKGIPHRLDIWGPHQKHDWPLWHWMSQTYFT